MAKYYHLINKDHNTLDNSNWGSKDAHMQELRRWAKSDHDDAQVDRLTDEEFMHVWNFGMIATDVPVTEPIHTPLAELTAKYQIETIL